MDVLNDPNVTERLLSQHKECDMFNKEITILKKLGEGVYGAVFLVKYDDGSEREYVMKNVKVQNISFPSKNFTNEQIEKLYPWRSKESDGYLSTKTYRTFADIKVPLDNRKMWEDGMLSEYLLYLKCSKFLEGESPHFIETGSFAHCKKADPGKKTNSRVRSSLNFFIQKVDGIVHDDYKCFDPYAVFVQGIACLKLLHKHKISHNDLKMDNLGYVKIKDTDMWKGKRIVEYDYFEYRIGRKSVYIPFTPYLVKVLDFGLSIDYGDNIGNRDVYDAEIDSIPEDFDDDYDYFFFIGELGRYWDETEGMSDKLPRVRWSVGYQNRLHPTERYQNRKIDYLSFLPKRFFVKPKGKILKMMDV